MFKVGILLVTLFIVQTALTSLQMRHFSKEFIRLRRKGKVVCGRQAGGFHAGAIVLFRIEDDGTICEARKLEGVTCFARTRDLAGFAGKHIGTLTEEDLPKRGKNLRKAIMDASNSYNKYVAGEDIPEPLSPFQRLRQSVLILTGR